MKSLTDRLEEALGRPVDIRSTRSVGGGCIDDSRRIRTDSESFFLKQVPVDQRSRLEAESAALKALAATQTVRVPSVIAEGEADHRYVLILEWIDLQPLDRASGAKLGEVLARLHGTHSVPRYGWDRDNFIGSTPQTNDWMDSWPEFYRTRRLEPQLALARANGYNLPDADPLTANIEWFFPADAPPPPPSPLHGDFWGGNAASDGSGHPVVYDPAFYWGDPETDIAFSRYFGGFPKTFYREYEEIIPLRPGWKIRQTLYNLYHVLNHLNIFGTSYLSAACRMIEELKAAIRRGNRPS